MNGTTPFRDSLFETAGVVFQAADHTARAMVKGVVDGLKEKDVLGGQSGTAGQGYEWVKGLLGKKEWKISCLDVLVRI